MRPKSEIYPPKRDDEHAYSFHMRSPPPGVKSSYCEMVSLFRGEYTYRSQHNRKFPLSYKSCYASFLDESANIASPVKSRRNEKQWSSCLHSPQSPEINAAVNHRLMHQSLSFRSVSPNMRFRGWISAEVKDRINYYLWAWRIFCSLRTQTYLRSSFLSFLVETSDDRKYVCVRRLQKIVPRAI